MQKRRKRVFGFGLLCLLVLTIGIFIIGCMPEPITKKKSAVENQANENNNNRNNEERLDDTNTEFKATEEVATFAGGCFWCVEHVFEQLDGVIEVTSGYTGGFTENPTYKEVSSGRTGHTEAVQVIYDPSIISYEELLTVQWKNHNPTDPDGQFVDRGKQYRPGIFYHNEEQKRLAEESKVQLQESGIFEKPVVTEITQFEVFYDAEDYHQDYSTENPIRYKFYTSGSGRYQFLDPIWNNNEFIFRSKNAGTTNNEQNTVENNENAINEEQNNYDNFQKPSDEKLREMLTEEQYKITQKDGTERPFENEYNDNKREGIYVDLVSGEPLFSSTDKYDSGTGWPSFTKPLVSENIVERTDYKLFLPRTEIRSKHADSHLGHVFNDGPEPTGLRYCMNSAALDFIPKEELEEKGYEEFMYLFE